MRTQMFGLSLVLGSLVGCGGGGSKSPDAKIFLDAPIDAPAACSIPAAPLNGSVGTAAMPATGNFFQTPTMGQYMGRTIFALGVNLPPINAAAQDSIEIIFAKPAAGPFPTNQAINFEISPTVMAPPARSVGFGDEDTAAMTVANLYWPSSGTITFSAISEANGSVLTGTLNNVKYREIDEQGADVPGGCTMEIGTLNLNLRQMMAFQPETNTPASELGTAGITKLPFTATN